MYLSDLLCSTKTNTVEHTLKEAEEMMDDLRSIHHSRAPKSFPIHHSDKYGNQVFGGNKGVMIKAYRALEKIVEFLKELDPSKPQKAGHA